MLKALLKKKTALMSLAAIAVLAIASTAFAYTDPAAGDLFYEAYELVIDKILSGPVGFVIAAFMFIGGIFLLVQGKGFLLPMVCIIGAALIIKCKDIVGSFGYSVDAIAATATSVMPVADQMTKFLL